MIVSASLFELMQREEEDGAPYGHRTSLDMPAGLLLDMPAGLLLDLQLASTVAVCS
jgi:hypothetical protein